MVVKVFLATFLFIFALPVSARELVDVQIDIVTPKKGPEAKQDAFDQAIEQATMKSIEEQFGTERAAKIWDQVGARVLKNSTRYVVFIKAARVQEEAEGTNLQVQLRISPDSLESILREVGALTFGSVRLLPLIQVVESKNSKYSWWAATGEEAPSLAQEYFESLLKPLISQFKGKNIFVLDPTPATIRMSIPANYRLEGLRREDQILLGQYLKADVVISGKVGVTQLRPESRETRVDYVFQLWQSKTGRSIAEVSRYEDVPDNTAKVVSAAIQETVARVFSELSEKLSETMKSGTLNLNVVRLQVKGDLNYRQQSDFKRLLANVRDIRVLKERSFEPSRVTFEAETSSTGHDLAKLLKKSSFPRFKVEIDNTEDETLVLSVRSLSSAQ